MHEKLKNLNLDRILDLEEAIAMSVYARNLAAEYEELAIEPPEWLAKSTDTLREEIARRTRAADLALLKSVEAEIESLKTATERRADAVKRLGDLQKKLGMVPAKAGK